MSKNLYNNSNPFDKVESIQSWLDQDSDFNLSKKQSWQNYKQSNLKTNYNIFNIMTKTTLKFISTHVVLSAILGISIFSAIGASAAEFLAPSQYKPTTIFQDLFNTNKQVERDPYTSLKPDNDNNVVKINDCDIAIKYPKAINGLEIEPVKLNPQYFEDKSMKGAVLQNFQDLSRPYENQKSLNSLQVSCADNYFDYYADDKYAPSISNEELAKYTGWFISGESKLENLKISRGVYNHSIMFKFNSKYYYITSVSKSQILEENYSKENEYLNEVLNNPGIFSEQVQIQFNSLAKNEGNTEIVDKPILDLYSKSNTQTPSINLNPVEFKKQSQFTTYENTLEYLKNTGSEQSFICGISNLKKYITSDSTKSAFVTNKNDYSENEEKRYYQRVLDFINNPEDTYTDTLPLAFIDYCGGGYYSNFLFEINNLKYNNTDGFKVVVVSQGQGEIGDPAVLIYAKKGDYLINLSQNLFSTDKESSYEKLNQGCNNNPTYNEGNNQDVINSKLKVCYDNFINNYYNSFKTPEFKSQATKIAQELIDTFEIAD
jgi:hypothetical protein